MRIIISSLFLIVSSFLMAQDSISVLFIGNSYTYVNDLPSLLNSLTIAKGDKLTVDSQTQGGATFNVHSANANTYTKIHSKPWDYVVVQGQSQEVSFSESQVNSQSLPYLKKIADSVYSAKFCTDLMLFMTWGYENGDSQWQPISTYEGMQSRLRNGYQRIADSVQASVSPVGMAWKYVRENYPAINLYAGDGSHPSPEGSYLAACTFYASLYRKSPVGANFYGSLPQATAEQLQLAAQVAVLDSLELWHLRAPENHTVAGFTFTQLDEQVSFTNASWKAQSYNWSFGDGTVSNETNPIYSYSLNGQFTVVLEAISECNFDLSSQNVEISTVGLSDLEKSSLKLLSFENGRFKIVGDLDQSKSMALIDVNGRQLSSFTNTNNEIHIDLSTQPKGIYYMLIGNISIALKR